MNKALKRFMTIIFASCIVLMIFGTANAQSAGASQIPATELIQPSQLAMVLSSSTGAKPIVLQVGSHVLYEEAHIPGAAYAGAGGDASGLQELRVRAAKISRTQFVVLYCGCCPWNRCPNIAPAYQLMHSLGFSHLKVLYIADNFGADWVDKGYPTVKGN